MSAFLMDERFFNQLAAELYAHANLQHSKLQWAVQHCLELRSVPENRQVAHVQEFTQACYALNVASVNYRYEQDYEVARQPTS